MKIRLRRPSPGYTNNSQNNNWRFNKTIDAGHLLTFAAVAIAAIALWYQRKETLHKVDDLQQVVNGLEEERRTRELKDLEQEGGTLEHFNDNMNYTMKRYKDLSYDLDDKTFNLIRNTNFLLDYNLRSNKNMTPDEKALHTLLLKHNSLSIDLMRHQQKYTWGVDNFIENHDPKKEKFSSAQELNLAKGKFNDSLKIHIGRLLDTLKQNINPIGEQIQLIEKEMLRLSSNYYNAHQ